MKDPTHPQSPLETFYYHVSNYMPTRLLYIDNLTGDGVRLIDHQELHRIFKPKFERITDEEIALRSARSHSRSREEAVRELVAEQLRYAILSHCWLKEGEPTFQMVKENRLNGSGPGYDKLKKFCAAAVASGCGLAWADTCCIDKTSSAELDEAIRSMFKWYRHSELCIIYLAGSSIIGDLERDPWFGRGWTLQELLAPARVIFYCSNWSPLSKRQIRNDKENKTIVSAVCRITGIDEGSLCHFSPGLLNVREKMLWASTRKTTRVEDIAYSLLGVFDISIPIAYGEGKRAFRRLMEAIVHDCREWQIFTWAGPHSPYAIAFPESPSGYGTLRLGEIAASVLDPERPIHRPWDFGFPFYSTTKKGLEVEVLLVEMILHIDRDPVKGTTYERLTLSPGSDDQRFFEDIHVACDIRFSQYSQWAVGILNYQTDGTGERGGMGELETMTTYVGFFLGTGVFSPYGKWEKVDTGEVVGVRTKDFTRRRLTTLWL